MPFTQTVLPSPSKSSAEDACQSTQGSSCGSSLGCGSAIPAGGNIQLSEWVMPEAMKDALGCVTAPDPLPYDVSPEMDPVNPWTARMLGQGFYNALQICFEQLPAEPRHIVHLGGCRQRDLARRFGFLLPFAKVTVTDVDTDVVRQTEAEIHCRQQFVHAPLPSLAPLDSASVDVVVMPNMGQVHLEASQWPVLLSELHRVLKPGGCVILSVYRPLVGKWVSLVPGASAVYKLLEMPPVHSSLLWSELLRGWQQEYGKVAWQLHPWPWHMAVLTPNHV